ANSSEPKILVHTMSRRIMAHHEWDALPEHETGIHNPPPMSTGGCLGPASASHSQSHIIPKASTPQAPASAVSLKVRSRKKPAVPRAASNGGQPGPGSASTYSGRASSALVTRVERPPVGALGK